MIEDRTDHSAEFINPKNIGDTVSMSVRLLTVEDKALISEFLTIDELISEEFYDYEGPDELLEQIKLNTLDVFGKIIDNKLVALVSCTDFYKVGRVRRILVHFDYRKKGVGSEMLFEVENHFKKQKMEKVEVFVKAGDARASSFLKKHGYTIKTTSMTGDSSYEKQLN